MIDRIPPLGLGTYRLTGRQAIESVNMALDIGYRHIDTAQLYNNEQDVGKAIAESAIPREDIFVTTKIWVDQLSREKLIPSLIASLERLKMDKVDLTLIHWPSPQDEVALDIYMESLAEAQSRGLTKHIGVSNFTIDYLQRVDKLLGLNKIATNQVEIQPFLQNHKLVAFAREQGLHLTAYMPLACGKVMQEPQLQEMVAKHDASAAQVTIAWLLQQGFAVIPSSTKREHLESNWSARDLRLSASDIETIEQLDRGERIANPGIAPQWD